MHFNTVPLLLLLNPPPHQHHEMNSITSWRLKLPYSSWLPAVVVLLLLFIFYRVFCGCDAMEVWIRSRAIHPKDDDGRLADSLRLFTHSLKGSSTISFRGKITRFAIIKECHSSKDTFVLCLPLLLCTHHSSVAMQELPFFPFSLDILVQFFNDCSSVATTDTQLHRLLVGWLQGESCTRGAT